MIVVSDTSPLMNLAVVGRLDVLQQLYGHILVPDSVRDEIVVKGKAKPGVTDIGTLEWIEIRHVDDRTRVNMLRLELDMGEAEAIALALEVQADLVLLDERKGRFIAKRLGLKYFGLLGVLVEAKQRRLLPAVKPVVDDLIRGAGFWIDGELYEQVLRSVKEQ